MLTLACKHGHNYTTDVLIWDRCSDYHVQRFRFLTLYTYLRYTNTNILKYTWLIVINIQKSQVSLVGFGVNSTWMELNLIFCVRINVAKKKKPHNAANKSTKAWWGAGGEAQARGVNEMRSSWLAGGDTGLRAGVERNAVSKKHAKRTLIQNVL